MKRWMYLLLVAGFIGASILSRCAAAARAGPHPDQRKDHHRRRHSSRSRRRSPCAAIASSRSAPTQDINRLAGPNTRRIDLRGKSVVPGFIDNHAHFQEEGAYWTLELRFDGIDTRKQVLDADCRAKAKATPNGGWVYNLGGWSPDQFSDDKKPVHPRGARQGRRRTIRCSCSSRAGSSTSTARRSSSSASTR